MTSRPLAACLLGVVLLLAGCGASDSDSASEPSASSARGQAAAPTVDAESMDDPAHDEDGSAEREVADSGIGGGDDAGQTLPVAAPRSARSSERMIKEGTMTIEVESGDFLRAYQRVVAIASELGGYVTASTSSTNRDDGGTAGSVTVRVPVDRYEELLTRAGDAGTLRSQDITSRDVTAEFTDLESRLRHLRAQEVFYLELLEDAQTVQDAITVKQQLDGIQAQIEQAQGRLDVLEDRTSYSTLTVEIVEPGASPLVSPDARPMLAEYWERARDGFVVVVGWILVGSVSLAPLLVPLLLAAVLWRVTRRRPATPVTVSSEAD